MGQMLSHQSNFNISIDSEVLFKENIRINRPIVRSHFFFTPHVDLIDSDSRLRHSTGIELGRSMDAPNDARRSLESSHPPINQGCLDQSLLAANIVAEKGKVSLAEVTLNVESCLRRHDQRFVFDKFMAHAQTYTRGLKLGTLGISKSVFPVVANELGAKISSGIADEMFVALDADKDDYLSYEEFQMAVQNLCPACQIEHWVHKFPLSEILTSALLPMVAAYTTSETRDLNQLLALSKCSDEEVQVALQGFLHGVQGLMLNRIAGLRDSFAAMASSQKHVQLHESKFSVNPMSSGDIPSFFEGLGERVGACVLLVYFVQCL
jgi:hypothetical protein